MRLYSQREYHCHVVRLYSQRGGGGGGGGAPLSCDEVVLTEREYHCHVMRLYSQRGSTIVM